MARAAEEHKPVMLFITATWCVWCKRLAADSFADDGVAKALQAFVPVLVDGEVEAEVASRFGVEGYPSIRFLTGAGRELGRVDGFVPKEQFQASIAGALRNLASAETGGAVIFDDPVRAKGLAVGASIPPVMLETAAGEPFDLRERVLGKPTVLVFYRGGWCKYCNQHLAELETIEDELAGLGYQLVAISPDAPAATEVTGVGDDPGFMLLSDPGNTAARRFGLAFRLDTATREAYRGMGLDLEAQDWTLPVPAAFVVDGEGKVAFAHVDPDYKRRIRSSALLEAARRVRTSGAQASDEP